MVKWQYLTITALMLLCLICQHIRLTDAETQLEILSDCCQRQELRLTKMSADMKQLQKQDQDSQQTVTELIRQCVGYFDDHDVSGLLEED